VVEAFMWVLALSGVERALARWFALDPQITVVGQEGQNR
jgi:hypothetical protein